jgi:putative glutamine amidotransferase
MTPSNPPVTDAAPRPLIGISGRRWPAAVLADHFPKAMHDAHVDLHFTEYGAAVAASGGLPVQLTRDAPVHDMLDRLDGLVLTGGADVDPGVYGHEPAPELGPTEPDRDHWELALLAGALDRGLPVLAICRGAQLANVLLGGTLVQHVGTDDGDGHPRFDDPRVERCHTVALVPGTLGAGVYGDRTEVNSLHHQTIGDLGRDLVVSGRSPDGTVEVIELPGRDFLGVQWHPEALDAHDPSFGWLVGASRRRPD